MKLVLVVTTFLPVIHTVVGLLVSSSSSSLESESSTLCLQTFVDQQESTKRFCEIGNTVFGRGLVATRDLQAGEMALRIPLSCVIAEPDSAENNNNNDNDDDDDSWTGRLANRLLDQPDNSPYKATLPMPPSTPSRGDWHESILQELQNQDFRKEINSAQNWRYAKWEQHCGSYPNRQDFLDALDLVCSRTIRIGDTLMLVPLLDMANHASRQQGGGYYKREGSHVCLFVGERGVRSGEEITLDYGNRRNEDWLIHYGFLPDRNDVETVQLPQSKTTVTWKDVGTKDISLQRECLEFLHQAETTLEDDLAKLQSISKSDFRLGMALNYRISRKILLSAVAGAKAASVCTSAFSACDFSVVEERAGKTRCTKSTI